MLLQKKNNELREMCKAISIEIYKKNMMFYMDFRNGNSCCKLIKILNSGMFHSKRTNSKKKMIPVTQKKKKKMKTKRKKWHK
jgi:hypothetical protein